MSSSAPALPVAALAWSQPVAQLLRCRPAMAGWLAQAITSPLDTATLHNWATELRSQHAPDIAIDDPLPSPICRAWLCDLRQRVFATLALRDLDGRASLEEVTVAITRLADLAVAASYQSVLHELVAIHGAPCHEGVPQEMLILGMGKLGGEELNVSSDIDLILLYHHDGETRGRRPLSHHEFYGRLAQRMMPLLSDIDGDGFVFRTDLRLRPDGTSGPLVWSLDALEHYLVTQGREWERYAWLKARLIPAQGFADSQPANDIAQLEVLRRPFVYRKYFDFDALEALRDLRERIRDDWNRRLHLRHAAPTPDHADNIKLGSGGIREIEFIVQLTQLVRGGRMPALQVRGLLPALHAQQAAGLIDAETAAGLEAAYRFLRRLEHALQYREDQQTHLLPRPGPVRETLAALLCPDAPDTFEPTLRAHRQFVERTFHDIFNLAGLPAQRARQGEEGPANDVQAALAAHLPLQADALLTRADALLDSPRVRSLPNASRDRLLALLPAAVAAAAQTRNPGAALPRMFDLLECIGQRRVYLTLLAEYPQSLQRVARMMAASEWVARYLIRHPLLLDSLIDWNALMEPIRFDAIRAGLQAGLDACVLPDGRPDVESQMDLMRDTQRQVSFHLLAQDLEGSITVEALGDALSLLADFLLQETLARAWRTLPHTDSAPAFAIIGYGKLGGKEMGYDSDLDLVFLYDDADSAQAEVYVRLGRRLVSWLNTLTPSGRLYEVDLRLRPDGDAGLVAASFSGFTRYQHEQAWTWEHQALTRARFVAGDPALGARFEQLREEVLLQPRDLDTLAKDVREMRQRTLAGHPNHTPLFDLKHDRGGMVDVEFVVQFLVLGHARTHRQLLGNLGNIALLRLAAQAGLLPETVASAAADAYRTLRREQHALRLQGVERARLEPERLQAERSAIITLWETVLGPIPG